VRVAHFNDANVDRTSDETAVPGLNDLPVLGRLTVELAVAVLGLNDLPVLGRLTVELAVAVPGLNDLPVLGRLTVELAVAVLGLNDLPVLGRLPAEPVECCPRGRRSVLDRSQFIFSGPRSQLKSSSKH